MVQNNEDHDSHAPSEKKLEKCSYKNDMGMETVCFLTKDKRGNRTIFRKVTWLILSLWHLHLANEEKLHFQWKSPSGNLYQLLFKSVVFNHQQCLELFTNR